jgi:hypothetical protein
MHWMIALLLCPALAWAQGEPEVIEPVEAPPEVEVPPEVPAVIEPPAVVEAPPVQAPALAGDVGAAIQAACASEAACGCGVPNCEAKYAENAALGGAALFQCLAALDCAAKCDPAAGQPGAVAHTTCIAPAIRRIEAEAAAKAAESEAAYRARMGIINNYPTGGVPKKRIYDQNGNLLREE